MASGLSESNPRRSRERAGPMRSGVIQRRARTGTCTKQGSMTLTQFNTELNATYQVAAWRFVPNAFTIKMGQSISATNDGGEKHTFTEVKAFVVPRSFYSFARRSSCALIATITVLADIKTAPTAGESTNPHGARRPAASGMATML